MLQVHAMAWTKGLAPRLRQIVPMPKTGASDCGALRKHNSFSLMSTCPERHFGHNKMEGSNMTGLTFIWDASLCKIPKHVPGHLRDFAHSGVHLPAGSSGGVAGVRGPPIIPYNRTPRLIPAALRSPFRTSGSFWASSSAVFGACCGGMLRQAAASASLGNLQNATRCCLCWLGN